MGGHDVGVSLGHGVAVSVTVDGVHEGPEKDEQCHDGVITSYRLLYV